MIKLILFGCNGYMGRVVTTLADTDPAVTIVAGIDINLDTQQRNDYPVYKAANDITEDADIIIDFSSPSALDSLLNYSTKKQIPLILCATGYSPEQINEIEKASTKTAIFRSGNMSLGINLLIDLVSRASAVLGDDFDIEIVEKHHKRKVDAPSGTALMLAGAAANALPEKPIYIYERESKREPRSKNEIGISSVRGGTVVGVHDVIFAGQDEVIEIRHTATSRDVFAAGAIKAAKYMHNKSPGMYNMKDVLR
ncbi:MAG: 4-hydroxy-tetrahydrodipicolinate reductase [Oscillospiraceae bacterium]|nr:4-hydroxy-tetrahydrodipicolinate reductase [Oscillospiraceae bacterium]